MTERLITMVYLDNGALLVSDGKKKNWICEIPLKLTDEVIAQINELLAQQGYTNAENCKQVFKAINEHYALEITKAKLGKNIICDLEKAITSFSNYYEMCDRFFEIQPLFYNEKKFWWAWDKHEFCWKMLDETDILNALNKSVNGLRLFELKQRTEILSALKMKARQKRPKEAPESWVQFKDKIFDYKTGKIFIATPEYFITNPIPFAIGESEETPTLDKWITDWVGAEWLPTIYEIIAFCCVPHYKINRIFCLNGEGRNGKSTLLHIITNFIGKKNCCSSSMDTIVSRQFESAKLYKKLVCEMGEINSGIFRKTELIKKLVGSDAIGFEFKGKDGFDDYNYAKIIVATNKLPETMDKTTGFYSKWIIIDFQNKFKENPNFLDAFPPQEFNNLAKKCLRLIPELMRKGEFTNEGTPEQKQERYEEKASLFHDFFEEVFEKATDEEYVPFFEIYRHYVAYCDVRGVVRKPSKTAVGILLKSKKLPEKHVAWTIKGGYEEKKTTIRAYFGIKFRETIRPLQVGEPDVSEIGLNIL